MVTMTSFSVTFTIWFGFLNKVRVILTSKSQFSVLQDSLIVIVCVCVCVCVCGNKYLFLVISILITYLDTWRSA